MSAIKARAVEAGIIHTTIDEESYTTPFGILLEFRSAEDVRAAMKSGLVHFEFGEYPSGEPKP
jgi:hypothetical protein